jgi:hypothetical protein
MKKLVTLVAASSMCLASASAFADVNLILISYINVGNTPTLLAPTVATVATFKDLGSCNNFLKSNPPPAAVPINGTDIKPFQTVLLCAGE